MDPKSVTVPNPFLKEANPLVIFILITVHILAACAFLYPSLPCLIFCLCMYCWRMFVLHGGCHRLFAHRSYKTTSWFEIIIAFFGCSTIGNSPLYWATHHRVHHQNADTENDLHSPHKGLWWSHLGWSMYLNPDWVDVMYPRVIPDWINNKILVKLDDNWHVCLLIEWIVVFAFGGKEFFFWNILSSVLAIHAESLTNSIAHMYGSKPYKCQFHPECDARNNLWVALINGGEGWHNNHHAYMNSARHGFKSWEVDVVYYTLLLLSHFGVVWELKLPAPNLKKN